MVAIIHTEATGRHPSSRFFGVAGACRSFSSEGSYRFYGATRQQSGFFLLVVRYHSKREVGDSHENSTDDTGR